MSKFYNIPVVWESTGVMEIEAESFEEALKYALGEAPLPFGDYLDDTCRIDFMSPTMNDVSEDGEISDTELLSVVKKVYNEFGIESKELDKEIEFQSNSKEESIPLHYVLLDDDSRDVICIIRIDNGMSYTDVHSAIQKIKQENDEWQVSHIIDGLGATEIASESIYI